MNKLEVIIEVIFLLDMGTKFLVEYREESTYHQVRDIAQISVRYIKNEFIYDLIPLVPLHTFFTFKFSHLLYILKCIRMLKTFQLLDTGRFMKHVKKYYEIQLLKVCEDPALAENRDLDQNKIMRIIMISYIFKIFKLVILIFQVSYFLGIFFYIYCDVTRQFESEDVKI